LKALDLLQHVQPDLRAVIAGNGPLRDTLEETAAAYQLAGRVKFLGHRDDVSELMAAAGMVVLPSSYEGLPNVLLEAMRFHKSIVATRAPGTTEVVIDGETGLLVPIGNPTQLARAIRNVVRDPALTARLGAAARRRVESHFRADTMVARYAGLYESVALSKRHSTLRPPLPASPSPPTIG
jgi:glycosyltransferase involved in cell wall biosynthesis